MDLCQDSVASEGFQLLFDVVHLSRGNRYSDRSFALLFFLISKGRTSVPIGDKGEQFDINAPPKFNAQLRIQHMHSSPRLPVMPSICLTGTQETEVQKRRAAILLTLSERMKKGKIGRTFFSALKVLYLFNSPPITIAPSVEE